MDYALINNLEKHLARVLPKHSIAEAYHYGVLPPGKLFRPKLAGAVAQDLLGIDLKTSWENPNSSQSLFASFIELHHAYTLVHDDLPCMDDDDMRRGRPSLHKFYGEWKAVLIGDGLLNASYQLLAAIEGPQIPSLFRFVTWALGGKGLIQGQVLDLSEEMTESFDKLLLTHQYKTSRLIQVALVGGYVVSTNTPKLKVCQDLFRLGHKLGIVFQILDDLTELNEKNLSQHEGQVNPWLRFQEPCFQATIEGIDQIREFLGKYRLKHLEVILQEYFNKINQMLEKDQQTIEQHLKAELHPIMTLLQRVS